MLAKRLAIFQSNFYESLKARPRALHLVIADQSDFLPQGQDARAVKPLVVVRGLESELAVDQNRRDHILNVHIGHVPIVNRARAASWNTHDDSFDVLRSDRLLGKQPKRRIDGFHHRRPHRIFFYQATGNRKTPAKLGEKFLWITWGVSLDNTLIAFEHVAIAREAGFDQKRRRHPVARGHPRVVESLFNMIVVSHPRSRSRGLLRSVRNQISELQRVQFSESSRGSGGSKRRAEACRSRFERLMKPEADIVTKN